MKLKRLKLRKNNWESETYEFDEVLTEFSSQKRVYEVVAKPVVEVYESQASITLELIILTFLFFFSFQGSHNKLHDSFTEILHMM
jgi:hypothetical protein